MTTTLLSGTSLERLLGTVGEAMTGKVVALQADTPADMALRAWSTRRCPGRRSRTAARGRRGDPAASAHDALYIRAARDGEAVLGPPPCPYALLVLGSGARRESTLRTDQDHAIVLADGPPRADDWLAALAKHLAATLERCGLPRCPGDVMATNPARRVPLRAWQDQFTRWIEQPEEARCSRRPSSSTSGSSTATWTPSSRCGGSSGRRLATGAFSAGWSRPRCAADRRSGSCATCTARTRA